MSGLLYKKAISINDYIKVCIPTVGQIIREEEAYYTTVSMLTATPHQMMVQLEDAGIDFTKITDFELFCMLTPQLREMDLSLTLDFSLEGFQFAKNRENRETVLWHPEKDQVIDRLIHHQIAAALRQIHFLEKPRGKPANEEARRFMLERARLKQARTGNKKFKSQLEGLIVAMVNTGEYKYDFTSTLDLTIYQFNLSIRQVIKKNHYNHLMAGIYAGTVDSKNVKEEDLNWLG